MQEKTEIELLTKERKKIDKKIKKLERRMSVYNFLTGSRYGGSYSSRITIFGGILAVILLGVEVFFLSTMLGSMIMVWVGISLIPYFGSFVCDAMMEKALTKYEKELKDLTNNRNEIVKHIDCIRMNEQYVAPTSAIEQVKSSTSDHERIINAQREERERREKRKQNLLEKARLRHIDVDKVLAGKDAYSSAKEYKAEKNDLKNFLEENYASFSDITNV